MGVTKKPRRVSLSASEVAFAKANKVPLEAAAKAKLPKRGRPAGSKNKPKEKPVDWEKLCKQLQGALAAQIKETDAYKNVVEELQTVATPVSELSVWQRIKLAATGRWK